MDSQYNALPTHNFVPLDSLTNQQYSLIKDYLVNMANRFNECFPSFIPLYSGFSSRLRVIDNFSDHISFNVCNKGKDNKSHAYQLDDIALESFLFPSTAIIVSDVSIKNNVATSILHMHINNKPLTKMIYHAVHITSTEAELFAIRCGINQATNFDNMSKIIVITDSIHAARKVLNHLSIPTKFSQQPSSLTFVISSNVMRTIPSSFRSVQAVLNNIFTKRSIKKLRPSI